MPKQQRRKPPKRKPVEDNWWTKLDGDIAELAVLLDEHRLETNAKGWLKLPWRSGWNAAAVAFEVVQGADPSSRMFAGETIRSFMRHWGETSSTMTNRTYYAIDDELATLKWERYTPGLRAALRCIQLMISNSHAGGAAYNAVLSTIESSISEGQMMAHRFNDVANLVGNEPPTPEIERLRVAFKIAWKRGLYHAAYALKPIE